MTYAPRPPLLGLGNTPGFGGFRTTGTPQYNMPPGATGGANVEQWNQYVADIQAALAQSSGFERFKLEKQYADAEKGRQNAIALQRMQIEGSKYGIDQQRKTAIDQLKENARQYDLSHGLELQKFGLDVADSWTKYASTYDTMFALGDFEQALGRAGLGQAPRPLGSDGSRPQAKTWQDFEALRDYGAEGAQPGAGAGAGGHAAADPRVKAVRGIMEAVPPTDVPGIDPTRQRALQAIEAMYFSGRPGDVERLGPERRKAAMGGLARKGWNANLVEEDRQRSLPWQTSVRRA